MEQLGLWPLYRFSSTVYVSFMEGYKEICRDNKGTFRAVKTGS